MPALTRPSFRQLLVAAFMALALLLAAVSLRGLSALEDLLDESRQGAARQLELAGLVDRLSEQQQTMERAARQYLVLGDEPLRQTFEAAADEAAGVVRALHDAGIDADGRAAWTQRLDTIRGRLDGAPEPARDAELVADFRDLDRLALRLGERVRVASEAGAAALQQRMEERRTALAQQIGASIAVAVALALALAWALARPLQRVERAIVALGANRLDERIEIPGPADARQIGRRLDWLRQRLAELEADQSRFLRHVSHELKTPLAALREGVALLGDGVAGPLTEPQREVTRILRDNVGTLQRHIEDLLRFNAAAFAARNLVRRPVDLASLVGRLVDEQRLQWQARGLRIAAQGPALAPEIDATQMASALGNLLANAVRFSPPGGAVEISWGRDGDDAWIVVRDHGPGVDDDDRGRIFEPFFRGRRQPEGTLPGTGIGLSIVAEIAGAHGGRVTLLPNDAARPGAAFRIELPHAFAP
ncbi:MAG: HAMP domain-containing histidine kinase [Rubrivivax sp.]|jgi:two-component system sensor histidine kinase GlrK|nr:HAMP domain-containing histidine kinase [Rubrivivax sp.]